MLVITNGTVVDTKVTRKLVPQIEKGAMTTINGIIVHQTGGTSAASALSSYDERRRRRSLLDR